MSTGIIAAGNEFSLCICDSSHTVGYYVFTCFYTCRVCSRANQNVVVVHYIIAQSAVAVRHEFIFRCSCMYQQYVRFTVNTHLQGFTGTNSDSAYFPAGFRCECWQ